MQILASDLQAPASRRGPRNETGCFPPSTRVPLIPGLFTSENPYCIAWIFFFYSELRTNRQRFSYNCTAIVIFGNPLPESYCLHVLLSSVAKPLYWTTSKHQGNCSLKGYRNLLGLFLEINHIVESMIHLLITLLLGLLLCPLIAMRVKSSIFSLGLGHLTRINYGNWIVFCLIVFA